MSKIQEIKARKVTVCGACFKASCWNGFFYCDDYLDADTVEKTIAELEALDVEHRDYYMDEEALREENAYLLAEVKRLNQVIIRTIEWAKMTGEAKEAEQYNDEIRAPFNHSDEPRGYARACEDVAEMLGEAVRPEEAAQ